MDFGISKFYLDKQKQHMYKITKKTLENLMTKSPLSAPQDMRALRHIEATK